MGILSSLMLTRSHHLFFPRNASKASTEGDDTAEDFFFVVSKSKMFSSNTYLS